MVVGDGQNQVDMTYIDNAAQAHLDALGALTDVNAPCAGGAYFVSNDQPVVLWTWVGELLDAMSIPRPKRQVSLGTAKFLGTIMEGAWKFLPLSGEPPMTRFLASAFARSHWYDMGPTKRDLGYRPTIGMEEGTRRTVAWFLSNAGTDT